MSVAYECEVCGEAIVGVRLLDGDCVRIDPEVRARGSVTLDAGRYRRAVAGDRPRFRLHRHGAHLDRGIPRELVPLPDWVTAQTWLDNVERELSRLTRYLDTAGDALAQSGGDEFGKTMRDLQVVYGEAHEMARGVLAKLRERAEAEVNSTEPASNPGEPSWLRKVLADATVRVEAKKARESID